jgi:hypothetical protein
MRQSRLYWYPARSGRNEIFLDTGGDESQLMAQSKRPAGCLIGNPSLSIPMDEPMRCDNNLYSEPAFYSGAFRAEAGLLLPYTRIKMAAKSQNSTEPGG